MSKLPKTDSIFYVCTEGMATSVAGAEALKGQLVKNGLYDVKIQHISLEWIPRDAKLVVCHESLKDRILAKVPHAHIVTVTDYLRAPEYATLSEELAALLAA
ncbi:MAG: hypothetical protein ILO43_09145 [Clostridia bacterium]|nr:hypothetical protein [Clostridia bacterium]MBP5460420.1 hypothetical protein [Clostridia bacterium]